MKKTIAAVLLSLGLAAPVAARSGGGPALFGPYKPSVGSWARYRFEIGGKRDMKGSGKWAVVSRAGKGFWIEVTDMKMDSAPKHAPAAGAMSMKMLIDGDGQVKKMYAQTPMGIMAMPSPHSKAPAPWRNEFKKGPMETVSTPAGKIRAENYSLHNGSFHGNVWAKKGVGPFGVVKSAMVDDKAQIITNFMLESYGTGAKPEISISKAGASASGMPPGMPNISALMRKVMSRSKAQPQPSN